MTNFPTTFSQGGLGPLCPPGHDATVYVYDEDETKLQFTMEWDKNVSKEINWDGEVIRG